MRLSTSRRARGARERRHPDLGASSPSRLIVTGGAHRPHSPVRVRVRAVATRNDDAYLDASERTYYRNLTTIARHEMADCSRCCSALLPSHHLSDPPAPNTRRANVTTSVRNGDGHLPYDVITSRPSGASALVDTGSVSISPSWTTSATVRARAHH